MGWDYGINQTKKDVVEALKTSWNGTVLAQKVVGNNVWTVLDTKGQKIIVLVMLSRYGGAWGQKEVPEFAGPTQVNCPLEFLDMADEPTGYAIEWRKRVRDYHEGVAHAKANRPPLEEGVRFRLWGQEYRLHSKAGPRRGWYAVRSDGAMLRVPHSHLAEAVQI